MKRKYWSDAERATLRRLYPNTPTHEIAAALNRPLPRVYATAMNMGLRKTQEYLQSPAACRLRRGDNVGAAYRYPKGHVPANKGLRRPGWAPGRMAQTQFKKGQNPKNWMPIGSTRLSKEGYLQRKITDTGYPPHDWKGVHIVLWEERYGAIPPGYAVKFIDGDKNNIVLNNFALVSRQDLMRLNTLHNYPKELAHLIQLRGALNRQINKRARRDTQD